MSDDIEFDSKLGRLGSAIEQLRELGIWITRLKTSEDKADLIFFVRDPEGYFRDAPARAETLDGETYVERQAKVGDIKMALLLSIERDAEYRKIWGLPPLTVGRSWLVAEKEGDHDL